jgi:hypothetical protein
MSEANNEKSRASGSAPSKPKTSAEDMVRVTRDAKIIDLQRDGHTYVQIGALVGVPKSTVADAVKRWMDANGPSADQVEGSLSAVSSASAPGWRTTTLGGPSGAFLNATTTRTSDCP